jgi:outer membrane protein TolC
MVSNPGPTPTPGGKPVTVSTGPSTFNFYKTQVSFSQILFDFGQTFNQIRSAQASEQSLQADLTNQQDTVVLNVKQSYFSVLAARQLLGVADDTMRQDQKHLEQAQGRYHVGLAPKFDVTNAEVQVANAELNQLTARNNVAVAWETLRNAMGVNGPLDFDIADVGQRPVSITEDQALTIAYANRPDLQSIQAQELANAEQITALQKTNLPTVTGNGAYQWSGSDFPLQSGWMIGATVNLTIFNGLLTTSQVGEQKANLSNLKFNEDLLRQSIALQVRQAVLNLQQAAASIRVSEKALQLARENLDLAEGRYNAGVGNIIELTDAQASLTTAQANYVQALYTYNTQLAALENAMAKELVSD